MQGNHTDLPQLDAIQPLVRYVDEDQAVIDTHTKLKSRVPTPSRLPGPAIVDARIELDGDDGFHDEHEQTLHLKNLHGVIRVEVVHPHRWWPANMGEQRLYKITVSLLIDGQTVDMTVSTIGLTSVRRPDDADDPILLVNGRDYHVRDVLAVDAVDENSLLPVGGDSLLMVRDHYGPDVLYHAADQAGILLVQCVPIEPAGCPEQSVRDEVARLASHPSLAGWCVGHLGDLAEQRALCLRAIDPTHSVFTDVPDWAA